MAVDIFLKLDGVKGEAQDFVHKGEMDVLSWSWGMSQSATTHAGGGGGSGKVSVHDISITKPVDAASATLQLFCFNGKHVANGTLTVRKAGENPLEYLKIDMEEIIISSISIGGSAGQDVLTENVSLNFRKVHTTYTPQTATGTGDVAKEAKWNIAENKEE